MNPLVQSFGFCSLLITSTTGQLLVLKLYQAAICMAGAAGHNGGDVITYGGLTLRPTKGWHAKVGKGMCAVMWCVCNITRSIHSNTTNFHAALAILNSVQHGAVLQLIIHRPLRVWIIHEPVLVMICLLVFSTTWYESKSWTTYSRASIDSDVIGNLKNWNFGLWLPPGSGFSTEQNKMVMCYWYVTHACIHFLSCISLFLFLSQGFRALVLHVWEDSLPGSRISSALNWRQHQL